MARNIRAIRLRRLEGRLGEIAYEMTKVHFADFRAPKAWTPPINAYRCETCLRICVDLAGVDRSEIDVSIESGRLVLRGYRELPEPSDEGEGNMQVMAMEIDHGRFERVIPLPLSVRREEVHARQDNGMLWIFLPLLPHA